MIILEKPYVSDYFQQIIVENNFMVLKNNFAQTLSRASEFYFVDEAEAINLFRTGQQQVAYTNSENAIAWINHNLKFTNFPRYISQFKDKYGFREKIKRLYPNYFFTKFTLAGLEKADVSLWKFPLIVKPSVGFFSMGVYYLETPHDWDKTKQQLLSDIEKNKGIYPHEVFDNGTFVVEEFISGEEYACDAYFDHSGLPVILGLYKHQFTGNDDVSDRVYLTSKAILAENLPLFEAFLTAVGKITGVQNFPIHIEARKQPNGTIIPIEVNPNRFGGWCTTAELTPHAFGFVPYQYFLKQQKPHWESILANCDGKVYSLMVLDNSTGIPGTEIQKFDYEALTAKFQHVVEMRQTDYKAYPVFGFLFARTETENAPELEFILHSDLKQFVVH